MTDKDELGYAASMNPVGFEIIATAFFVFALIHTFSVKIFQKRATRCVKGSIAYHLFHALGEIELVFAIWASLFMLVFAALKGGQTAAGYLTNLNFTEPAFVLVVLSICSTRPILKFAEALIEALAKWIPLKKSLAFYVAALTAGPLLGSLITEPAAMTVTALILSERYFPASMAHRVRYATLGLLFVNISIGGTLTPFAAPPILMVAPTWGWDISFMLSHFGWRGALSCAVSTLATTWYFRRELGQVVGPGQKPGARVPGWVILLHILFLGAVVIASHHAWIFLGVFMGFFALYRLTKEHQYTIQIREACMVALFLAGLVVLGPMQRWWLEPLLTRLGDNALFFGATALTAITDNAALTYLGAQVPGLSDAAKIALVSGAVVGGGLTVIANAPNPAGYGILNPKFDGGISPLKLLMAALPPTVVAIICFWFI